jgi:hypothetical protein
METSETHSIYVNLILDNLKGKIVFPYITHAVT